LKFKQNRGKIPVKHVYVNITL